MSVDVLCSLCVYMPAFGMFSQQFWTVPSVLYITQWNSPNDDTPKYSKKDTPCSPEVRTLALSQNFLLSHRGLN